jgi:hypothetical protein
MVIVLVSIPVAEFYMIALARQSLVKSVGESSALCEAFHKADHFP